ncbi:MAG: hypothetical protein JXQ93_13090 [Flavobacteriaceae bacterium]
MKLKKIILFSFLAISFGLQAQVKIKKQSREKIHALKIAYLTDKLDLTEQEAEKFWPVYNKFDKKLQKLRTVERYKLKKRIKDAGGIEALSEKEAEIITELMLFIEKEMYDTKKAFFTSLKKVITFKKIIQLQIAEREFTRNMFRKLRKKTKERKNKK